MDRRVKTLEMLEMESEDDDAEPSTAFINHSKNVSANGTEAEQDSKVSLARRYVGELIQKVEFSEET